jgi:nucleotide-binding universal stress UspA family protein
MKKILLPTDFSKNAKNATDYALALFGNREISLTLLNVFQIPYASIEVSYAYIKEIANQQHARIDALYIAENDENKEVIKKFIDYELNLNFAEIPHELKMERGENVEEAIENYIDEHPIDLMAMVTTKGNLFYNLFHTSLSKKIVRNIKIPLLIMHTHLTH